MPLIDLNGLGHFKDKENEMVAADYSASKTYPVGSYVYYNGVLYRCKTAITSAEAWTSGHWTAAKLADDFSTKYESVNNTNENLVPIAKTINGLYIDTSGKLASTSNANRTICVEAKANKKYRIKKSTSTIMRVGCGSSASLASGDSLTSYSGHATASSDALTVETDGTNHFIYVQLFASNDSSSLQSIGANTPTLSITEDFSGEIGEIEDSQYGARIPLYPCQFIGDTYVDGTSHNSSYAIGTIRPLVFAGYGKVKIYSSDSNIYFRWMLSTDASLGLAMDSFEFDGKGDMLLNIYKADHTAVTASDLDNVYVMTSKAVYDQYIKDNWFILERTAKFPDYGGSYVYRYGMFTDSGKLGFAQRGYNYYRITCMPVYCENDVKIVCGKNSSSNSLEIVVGGVLTTINQGQWMDIPARTVFQVAFKSASTTATNNLSGSSVYIVAGTEPSAQFGQWCSVDTVTRADCAFLADGKIFAIANDTYMKYSVYSLAAGEYVVKNTALDHTPGHANSCNYLDGNAYVSDWTDNTLIHVYSVDTENNTLTYTKDITLPESNYGSVEYHVLNGENEILFLGWQSGNSATTPNTLVYGLYVYDGVGSYELAWAKKAHRQSILQGFTYQDNYLYYIECEFSTYDTIGICRIDLRSGLSEKLFVPAGTLSENEGEQIFPIGNRTFVVIDQEGKFYTVAV